MSEKVDVAIVGAGVVGLAAAARLAGQGRTVVVLEKNTRYGTETSSRNSEVLHAGIYYPPDSLKCRLCHEGRKRIYRLSEEAGIFTAKLGKLIVAVDAAELGRLDAIRRNAEAGGAEGLMLIDGTEAARRVPGLKAEAALWCPETGIVDSEELMRHLHARAQDADAFFLFGSPLLGVERLGGGYRLRFGPNGETLETSRVVNAAGLHCDTVAAMAGIDVDEAGYRLHWCRGLYFRYRGEARLPHLVYPVPAEHGLGIHMTPDREGRIRFGPDTCFVDSLDYEIDMARREAFHGSVTRYWPVPSLEDLVPDTAGIRPKLSGPEGGFRDFVVREESDRGLPGWVNLMGIESPGLTAAPAIAEETAALLGF